MRKYKSTKTVIAGLCMAFIAAVPSMLSAETLRVLRGDITAAINVPIGGTVVVDGGTNLNEISIANPKIADISFLSDRLVAITGSRSGRTTFTALYPRGRVANVEILVAPNMPEFDETNPVVLPDALPAEIIPVLDGAASDAIIVPSSGAVVVKTDVPFAELEMGNPDVADVARLTDSMIYLLGKDAGRTTLTLLRNDGQPATIIQVIVLPNMEGGV